MAIQKRETRRQASRFSSLKPTNAVGPFALTAKYESDSSAQKVNLLIGAYRDDDGKPWQLNSVTQAKIRIKIESCTHEYLPLGGSAELLENARQLVFGSQLLEKVGDSVASIQTVSGTGANSLISRFAQEYIRPGNIWLPDPTWENHDHIWRDNAPEVTRRSYPYYKESTKSFDFEGMMRTLQLEARENDAILLHACAHNPTGLDPTADQWKQIAALCHEKRLFVVFDSAYQGFASGDLDRDAWAMRHFFMYPDMELAICQSFSKNLGLYGERVGALHLAVSRASSPSTTKAVLQRLTDAQRCLVSMAPLFGARVANEVLSSKDLRGLWEHDLVTMSGRIGTMRMALHRALLTLRTPGSWDHISEATGMFCYTGLTREQVDVLQEVHHVYLLPSGRMSLCGLTTANVDYVAEAIHSVVVAGGKAQH